MGTWASDHVHPFLAMVLSGGSGLFQQNPPCNSAKIAEEWSQEQRTKSSSEFPSSQSDWAIVGCAGPANPIHGGHTSQPTEIKMLLTSFVLETTGHVQRSCWDASQLFWQYKGDLIEYLAGDLNVVVDHCISTKCHMLFPNHATTCSFQ